MKALLIVIIVMSLIEAGGSIAYLLTGKWPQRTRAGIAINGIFCAVLAAWALYEVLS